MHDSPNSNLVLESQHCRVTHNELEITDTSSPKDVSDKTTAAVEKKLKKEQGRLRAKQIAIERAQAKPVNPEEKPTSTRHGARNQNRHQKFTKWLIKRFPHILDKNEYAGSNCDDKESRTMQHILDVAGGKGELAARLVFCHNASVVMVDPREANIRKCFEEVVFKGLPKKHQEAYRAKIENGDERSIELKLENNFEQLIMYFDDTKILDTSYQCDDTAKLQNAIESASLIVGMHADGATEAIVNIALKFSKPFVVVPCCVFPNFFVNRMLNEGDGKQVKVRTHEQFCRYLHQMDKRFVMETLPFDGRNVAIWWDGKT